MKSFYGLFTGSADYSLFYLMIYLEDGSFNKFISGIRYILRRTALNDPEVKKFRQKQSLRRN